MKTRSFNLIFALILLIAGCSSSDDSNNTPTSPIADNKVVESFDPISISFVHEDGTSILSDECITPNSEYAVQIETTKNSQGNTQISKVEYTINGNLFSMSFSQAGIKRNPISLVKGRNIAELVTKAISTEMLYIVQGDFQLVN